MQMKKKYKVNLFRLLVVINLLICSSLLIHDFIFWGIIPMFKGEFYQLTYLGLFLDMGAILMVDVSVQLIKEWL